jgi:glyoxylase-like metal-dependent hydrolase (beta-lactamase superfamily II)
MKYETIIVGSLETNCYLVYCEETLECAVVDPGAEADKIFPAIEHNDLKPSVLLNTHGHIDHIGANKDIKEKYDIPLLIHSSDSPMLRSALQSGLAFFLGAKNSPPADEFLKDEETVKFGNSSLKVIHTPGHSPGSVSFLGDGFVLSGDSLFCQGVGRTDLPGGSWTELINSIKDKILTLPPETVVLPGHGPLTMVSHEKNSNPFIT